MGSGGEAEKEMIGSRAQAVRDSCPCEALGKTCARRCDNGRVAGQKNVVVFARTHGEWFLGLAARCADSGWTLCGCSNVTDAMSLGEES